MKTIIPYKTINGNFNTDHIEYFDVMPYLIDEGNEEKKLKRKRGSSDLKDIDPARMPETFEEYKKFVLDKSMYRFGARCEYEVIVHAWPIRKNDYKLDVYEQIKQNIDVITTIFIENISKNKKLQII